MNIILNAIPVIFIVFFFTIVVMAIRQKGEGSASTNTHQRDNGPATNINGLPMIGGVDVLGNPYGITHNH